MIIGVSGDLHPQEWILLNSRTIAFQFKSIHQGNQGKRWDYEKRGLLLAAWWRRRRRWSSWLLIINRSHYNSSIRPFDAPRGEEDHKIIKKLLHCSRMNEFMMKEREREMKKWRRKECNLHRAIHFIRRLLKAETHEEEDQESEFMTLSPKIMRSRASHKTYDWL